MILDFKEQFCGKFPQDEAGLQELCMALRSASASDVMEYTDALGNLLDETRRLPIWCERFLMKSGSSQLLAISINAATKASNSNKMQVSDLFDACLQFYMSGKIGVSVLEDHWVKLIDTMEIRCDHPYLNPFYAVGRGVSVARGLDLSCEKMPRLDASLARHAVSYGSGFYEGNVVNTMSWLMHSLNIPETFKVVAGWYSYKRDPSRIMHFLEAITRHGQIKPEHLLVVADIYGLARLGESYERVIMYKPKLADIYPFIDTFSERDLFSEKSLKRLLHENRNKCSLSIYDILDKPEFVPSKFPLFIDFTLTATPVIYGTLSVNDVDRRLAIRNLNISMNRNEQVWKCEVEYFKRQLRPEQCKVVGDNPVEILAALKIARPPEYKLALKAINDIGMAHVGPSLAGSSREFINDFINNVKMDMQQKRVFMKIFPQARAQILEDDLGM